MRTLGKKTHSSMQQRGEAGTCKSEYSTVAQESEAVSQ